MRDGLRIGTAPPSSAAEPPLDWTTPNTVALQLQSMQLRKFSQANATQPPVLICAPYALHSALIADFARDHSLVEALQRYGMRRLYVTDWRSATPDMRQLSIDNYLADLNVAIDEIGAPVDLVGLCQGGWLSLVYAARFPARCGGWCSPARRSISPRRRSSRRWWPRFRKRRSSRWCSRATASSAASTCSALEPSVQPA